MHNIYVHDQDKYKKCTLMHNIHVHDQDKYEKCTLMQNKIHILDQDKYKNQRHLQLQMALQIGQARFITLEFDYLAARQ